MLDEADELYALPADEFTAARDALAKRLRGEKRREEADEVKALRRPSVAAGAINRAVREHGADDLLAAGEALREAHEALLSGDADAAAVREAMARERDAVRAFTSLALGDGASEGTAEKVRATLHAASVDDEVREALAAGRLEREAEAGADPVAMLAAPATAARGKGASSGLSAGGKGAASRPSAGGEGTASGPSAGAKRGAASGPSARGKGAARSGGRGRQSDAERRRAKAAERARAEAERAIAAQTEAEAAAERARSALAEAEEAARKARAVVEDREGRERAARRAVKEAEAEAERRRTEARRAVKTAESRA